MRIRSLRARILLAQSALIVALSALTLLYVGALANRSVRDRIEADLARSREVVAAAERERYRRLALVGELVASFPELLALFSTDAATIRDYLQSFKQRHGRDELLIALDASAAVVARTDKFAPLQIPGVQSNWVEPALEGRPATGYLEVDGQLHHAVLAAAESAGTVFGFVLAAAPVDEVWARALSEASDQEIVVLGSTAVVASTLLTDNLPWRSALEWPSDAGRSGAVDVDVGGERFQAISALGGGDAPVRVLSLQSQDAAFAPYRSIQVGLIALSVLAAGAGIAGSAMLARSITAPVNTLAEATRQVAAGNYEVRLELSRDDEIGELARGFSRMTEGLRERSDMQKFVSQSTVEMIRRHSNLQAAGSERRTLTLLFSDIRGFTAFAEGRSPDEAVAVLNRYLRLQADCVTRFGGDVDKFVGDAVFAHFGGSDMALDAIRCAVAIHRLLADVARNDPGLPALAVGIGIATGEVTLGSIGSEHRLDYTAIGPAVNLSARLCAMADAREVLLGESTFARVRDLVAADPVPPQQIKGFSAPVQIFRMAVT